MKDSNETQALPRTESDSNPLVLIADDEPLVALVISRLVTRMGYTVLTADNGQIAVDVFRHSVASIRCVILDVDMPVTSGPEAARVMRQMLPTLPIIFMSGYVSLLLSDQIASVAGSILLEKPFGMARLREALHYLVPTAASLPALPTL